MHFGISKEALHHYFFSQPHQPFFTAAFVNAWLSMAIFALSYTGSIHLVISPATFHAYSMLFLLFTPAFTGFLFTTFPRFNATPPIKKEIYVSVFWLTYVAGVLYLLGSMVSSLLVFMGMAVSFAAHLRVFLVLLRIYKQAHIPDMHDSFWILASMGLGVVSHLLFIGAFFYEPLFVAAKSTGVYGYAFMLALSVAQRMIPFFSHAMQGRNDRFMPNVFFLVMGHIGLEILYAGAGFLPDMMLAYLTFKEIRRWKLPFPNPNPLLWILHVAVFWIPVAFLFSGMERLLVLLHGPSLLALGVHAMMVGFLFTVLIGFGTRVTIGHSGNVMQATRWETVLFNLTQLLVVLRLFVSLAVGFGLSFFVPFFWITVAVWLGLLTAWAWRFFPLLISGKQLR